MNATEGPGPAPAGKQKKKDTLSDVLLGALEEIRTPDLLIRSQTLYPTELPAQVQDIYYHRHRGLSTVFSKKNEFFFRGEKKAGENPGLPRPGPLTFGPGAPAAPSLSNAGTAFPSPPETAPAFPSLAGRATAASPSPGTALPALPRLGQAPVRFPAGGRHEPCLVSGKKARLCPALPFCRARRQGCTLAKTKSPATPEGVAGPVCFAVRR